MEGALFTLHRRLLETPLAKIDSEDISWWWGHTIQQTGDALTGSQDGHAPDIQGAAQLMHKQGHSSRSQIQNPDKHIQGYSREHKGHPSGMCASGHTIWEQAVVGALRCSQMKWPLTSPWLTIKVHPGQATHNPTQCSYANVKAYCEACNLRLQIKAIRSKTSRWMQ